MNATPHLPGEVLASIFSFSGPNSTSPVSVSRSWRPLAEKSLYRSITIFDKTTVASTLHDCTGRTLYYYSKKRNQNDGASIDIVDKDGVTTSDRLEMLCQTLAANDNRLAALVRELNICVNIPEMKYFLSIANNCRNTTQLYFRGPEDHETSYRPEAAAVKDAIKESANLEFLAHEGDFPGFTMADVAHILSTCPRIWNLSLRLVKRETGEDVEYRALEFPQLRKLQFVPYTVTIVPVMSYSMSFPGSSDLLALSTLSFPNLIAFSAHTVLDGATLPPMKRCLRAWAPKLAHLTLCTDSEVRSGILDDVLPSLASITDLTSCPQVFSVKAILGMKLSLQRLDLGGWLFNIKNFTQELEANLLSGGELALPQLAHVRARIYENSRSSRLTSEQTALMDICRTRNISIERIARGKPRRSKRLNHFGDPDPVLL